AFYYLKPLLTSPNTAMSELAGDFSFDIDEKTVDLTALYEWYLHIDPQSFEKRAREVAAIIERDRVAFKAMLDAVLK
ncbi:MAG: hypothetical protein IJB94_07425, partial [Clostridia bacterium]|nr:hypothetical protein [Clostridia bacterium]